MGSDPIPGLAVVLSALSRADLGEGEDRTGPAAPRCTEHRQGEDRLSVSGVVGGSKPMEANLTDNHSLQ